MRNKKYTKGLSNALSYIYDNSDLAYLRGHYQARIVWSSWTCKPVVYKHRISEVSLIKQLKEDIKYYKKLAQKEPKSQCWSKAIKYCEKELAKIPNL